MFNEECKCPIRPGMTYEELTNEILIPELYCTSLKTTHNAKGWICEALDKELERARREKRQNKYSSKAAKQRKIQKAKALKKEGYSDEQIVEELRKSKPKRRRKGLVKIKSSKTNFGSF